MSLLLIDNHEKNQSENPDLRIEDGDRVPLPGSERQRDDGLRPDARSWL
jgi:hypothetical protein